MRILSSMMFGLALLLGIGCQASYVEETPSDPKAPALSPEVPSQGDISPMPPTLASPNDPGVQAMIDKAIADLTARLSIAASQIELVDAAAVVWPDASMGCPQPNMKYIQVPQDGLLIRLEANGQIYPYHSGGNREPFLCEIIRKDSIRPPQIDLLTPTPAAPHTSATPDNSIPPGEGT